MLRVFDIVAHLFLTASDTSIGPRAKGSTSERSRNLRCVHRPEPRTEEEVWFFDALRREALGTVFEIIGQALDQHSVLRATNTCWARSQSSIAVVNAALVADLEDDRAQPDSKRNTPEPETAC